LSLGFHSKHSTTKFNRCSFNSTNKKRWRQHNNNI